MASRLSPVPSSGVDHQIKPSREQSQPVFDTRGQVRPRCSHFLSGELILIRLLSMSTWTASRILYGVS